MNFECYGTMVVMPMIASAKKNDSIHIIMSNNRKAAMAVEVRQ